MPQLEYGDYYKFRVSVGIALIIVSLVAPWLFLREPFDLLLQSSQLLQLTPTAHALIADRQHLLAKIFWAVPWFSLASFMSGLFLATAALVQWRRRQSLRDEVENLGLEKLRLELKAMTPLQVQEKHEADVEQLTPVSRAERVSAASEYLKIEQRVSDRLRRCFDNSYTIRVNQRLKNTEYDVILESKTDSPDVIVEIKYIREGFHFGWLRASVSRLILANDYYADTLNRRAVSTLLIVTAESAQLSAESFERMKGRALELSMVPKTNCRVERLSELEINSVSCEALSEKIFV